MASTRMTILYIFGFKMQGLKNGRDGGYFSIFFFFSPSLFGYAPNLPELYFHKLLLFGHIPAIASHRLYFARGARSTQKHKLRHFCLLESEDLCFLAAVNLGSGRKRFEKENQSGMS